MNSNSKSRRKKKPTQYRTNEAAEKGETANPEVGLTPTLVQSNSRKAPYHCQITCQKEQSAWERFKPIVEVLGLIALVVYTIYTIKVYWANKGAADAAQSAAKTARDTLIMDTRPWVGFMGNGHAEIRVSKGLPIEAHIEFQNFGKSPAFNESSFNSLTDRPIGVAMPKFDGYPRNNGGATITLMPNAVAVVDVNTAEPSNNYGEKAVLTEADVARINAGEIQLFLYGTVWYDDAFGQAHRTEYCLQYILPVLPNSAPALGACKTHNYAD